MKHIKLFENFINEEVDISLMSGIAKNLYLELKKKPINQPLSKEGKPMLNIKGEPIKYTDKIKMTYQNEKLGKLGTAKYINREGSEELHLSYHVSYIYITGFQKKEEAEETIKSVLNKYPKDITGEVKFNPGERGWGDTYGVSLSLKQAERRSKFDLGTGFSSRENKNDRKRKKKKDIQ
jgi:hypothetical protein